MRVWAAFFRHLCAGLFLVFWASGCATTTTFRGRVAQESAAFAALSPADQERVQAGQIELGDSPAVVFIALGAPDRKSTREVAGGSVERWQYDGLVFEPVGSRGGKAVRVPLGPGLRLMSADPGPPSAQRAVEPILVIEFVAGRALLIQNSLEETNEYVVPLNRRR